MGVGRASEPKSDSEDSDSECEDVLEMTNLVCLSCPVCVYTEVIEGLTIYI